MRFGGCRTAGNIRQESLRKQYFPVPLPILQKSDCPAWNEDGRSTHEKIISRALNVAEIAMDKQMIAQPGSGHAASEHFPLNIRECRADRISGMPGVNRQILPDFHDDRPFSEFTVRLRNQLRTGNRFSRSFPSGRLRNIVKNYHIGSSCGFHSRIGLLFHDAAWRNTVLERKLGGKILL